MIIAIDGPAASGKGTLAKRIAAHLDLPHLDTGLLYRIVAMDLIVAGHEITDAKAAVAAARNLDLHRYREDALRASGMGEAASVVSAIPDLRAALLDFQRTFAAQPGGAVLDGRDTGTVICPDADIKFFVTARPQIRARRRAAELTRRGESLPYKTVLADIRRRDERDSSRSAAPLRAALDAHWLDTSDMDVEAMVAHAMSHIDAATLQPSA